MRFIHLADVHLGAVPDLGYSWSQKREEEIWSTFRRVFALIRKNPVDFLFIAGDLFHRQPLLRELKEVNYLCSTISDTQVVIIAGNHDHLKRDSFYRGYPWADNVFFIEQETCKILEFPRLKTWVYGFSYGQREITEPVYERLHPLEKEGTHILLAHGGDASHLPFRIEALKASGFDYIALGHIHKPQILEPDKIAYSGALEPIDRNDTGPHGLILGEVREGRVRIKFQPLAVRSYCCLPVQAGKDATQFSLEEQIKKEILKQGKENIYRLVLQGERAPEVSFQTEPLLRLGNILEVQDETHPAYDLEELCRKYQGTLIEAYIRQFQKPGRTETEEKALYYGLQALLKNAAPPRT